MPSNKNTIDGLEAAIIAGPTLILEGLLSFFGAPIDGRPAGPAMAIDALRVFRCAAVTFPKVLLR
jgi:hypothetical protein